MLLVTDLIKLLGYPLATNNSVIRLSDCFCDTESVEHLMALFISPITIARLEEIEPWLSHGVIQGVSKKRQPLNIQRYSLCF